MLGLGLVNILAFVGALAAVLIVHQVAGGGGRATLTTLLLTGYAVGSMLAAGLAMSMYLAGSQLRQIFFYLLGSLSRRGLAEPHRGLADHPRRDGCSSWRGHAR